jgi:molecular chaperone DnaK
VHVSAKDKASGKEQKVTIQASGGLKEEEIEAMVKDAEKNAAEDKKRKEAIEVRNRADTLIYSSEKSLKEHGDKVSSDDKKSIEEAIAELKSALEEDNLEKINEKTEVLAAASMKIGEAMYKTEGMGEPSAAHTEHKDSGDDKVVDGQFKDVTDNK